MASLDSLLGFVVQVALPAVVTLELVPLSAVAARAAPLGHGCVCLFDGCHPFFDAGFGATVAHVDLVIADHAMTRVANLL